MKNDFQVQFEPCYFYIDHSENKKGRIWPLCLKCGHKQKSAWYWNKGYDLHEIICHKCGKLIYKPKQQFND